jgi:hypothetical protein
MLSTRYPLLRVRRLRAAGALPSLPCTPARRDSCTKRNVSNNCFTQDQKGGVVKVQMYGAVWGGVNLAL